MTKPGRNDPCPCGSGKKYKKCCELKVAVKRPLSQKIGPIQSASGISSLFNRKITQIATPKEQPKPEEPSVEKPEEKKEI